MDWQVVFLSEAKKDLLKLAPSVRPRVLKAIQKVSTNPLPAREGGFGKPLGNKHGFDLTGLLKIKLRTDGIRIVYKLEKSNDVMKIIVIGVRSDLDVYRQAVRRKDR